MPRKVSYMGVEDMQVAVMGCIVNGPGESKHANIGIRRVQVRSHLHLCSLTVKGINIAGR